MASRQHTELVAAPRNGGGSILRVTRDRPAKNVKARLFRGDDAGRGRASLAKELLKAPAISGQGRE